MIEHNQLTENESRSRFSLLRTGRIGSELTKGVLTAIGGLIAVAILVLLASFVISAMF
jgi:hypothetical protein